MSKHCRLAQQFTYSSHYDQLDKEKTGQCYRFGGTSFYCHIREEKEKREAFSYHAYLMYVDNIDQP